MSRIGDALKRAGALDQSGQPIDLELGGGDGVATLRDSLLGDVADAPPPVVGSPAPPAATTIPTLGEVAARPDSHLIVNPELPAVAAEQYRRLAATLHHVQEDRGIRRVIVSSAVANEGKTLTSTNLALTLSHSYAKRVLLIDADLRRPRVNVMFGIPNGAGLSEALDRADPRKLALVQVSPLLSVLPAGRATPDPIAGLTSSRMAAILDEAVERFDWVILDTPPVGLLSDALLLAAMADVAILVVGAGSTPCGAVQRALDALGRERVLGVVLNRADESVSGGDYYDYYGYYGSPGRGEPNRRFFSKLFRRS